MPDLDIPPQRDQSAKARAVYLLRVVAAFIDHNDLEEYTFHYDGADCDGSCLADDVTACAEELERVP